jgi:hypothetical protein
MKAFCSFVAASLLLGGLYLSSIYNYLLFHSLAEIFSIVIACGIFITAWNSRRFLNNDYLLFIGISYLFIASLDLIHTFAYSGMNIFRGYGNNLPTQLWIAARYMEGLSLFIAPLILRRKINPGLIFLIYTAATFVLIASIFEWNIFPDCFVEGTGLTPFKKGSEFVISLILLSAIGLLLRNREHFQRTVLQWLVLSIGFTIASELAFTFYVHVYGLSNLIGHYFKILSFYFIYKAIIETGLSKPYDLLFRQLKQSEARYREGEARFKLLSETAGLLMASRDPQKIVNELCSRLLEHLDCQVFFNYVVDKKAKRLRLNAYAGIPEVEARNLEWMDFGADVCGCIARDGVRVVADDICPTPCPRTELVKSFGIQAYACHPLNAQGKIIGTLSFGTKTRTRFSPQDLELMKTVTDQVAVAMQRVGLIGELRNSRDELEVRVRERTAELNSRNKELQDFVFLTSHDLQEPLRKIQVFGDLLSEKFRGAIGEKGLDYLSRMRDAAARMQDLLKSLLSYSRLTTGENMIERVELAKAVEEALLNLDIQIKETDAKIEIDELPVIEVDYSQAVLLFQNLIANALKFHKELEPPRVKIHAALVENGSSGEGEYEIRVEDNGIGFDEKYLEKVFTPFQRLHRRDEYEGLGIGVPICKKIAERHGGTLTARSTPGKGSTFIVTLPVNHKAVLH